MLIETVLDICDSVLRNDKILTWNYKDSKELALIGESLVELDINFKILKRLRSYIVTCTKSIRTLEFKKNK